ncbi:hypothetical protein OFY17_05545 [Marinomonas sp. C2222]|uniref:Uncharacterized protein n=1 Tax=Marinomonas sargassi TaxID=2984494 RepID=A0ABT2YRH2_9GAMM|nr:hypothetical protein [Marinomonas sargassi]MCV2402350.1 hypothetical protein [Marinomonas sargassi]
MNKKQFLNTYKKIGALHKKQENEVEKPSLYKTEHDEKLIKDFHFAQFQKNRDQLQDNPDFKALTDKDEWTEEDVQTLLKTLK